MRVIFLFIILASFPGLLIAGFSLSGSTITQTGTDNDLSGLGSIGPVNVSSQNGIDVYNIGNRRLVVRGDLTIDPEKEMLIVGYNSGEMFRVENSGSLTIGMVITKNGVDRYSEGMAIFFEDCPLGFTNRVSFYDNATFNWNGGTVSLYAGKFGFYGNNVTVRINSDRAKLIYRTEDEQNQIRQETNDFISTAFTFINGDFTIVGANQQLDGYTPIHCSGAISFSGATPNVDITLRNYAGGDKGNTIDVKHWQGSRPIFINSLTGSQLNCGPHISGGSAYGVALVYQEFQLTAKTADNNPLEGVQYYIRDTNHGNRETYNRESHVVNNTNDNVYAQATDATGQTPLENILLAANVVNSGGSGINTGDYAWDYRGKFNDATDLFDVHVWSYGHNYAPFSNVEMKGTAPVNLDVIMYDDPMVSSTKTEAAAITGINIAHDATNDNGIITISDTVSLCDLYDFVKLDKVSGAIAEPAIDLLVTQPTGNLLDFANYQLEMLSGGVLEPCDKFQKATSDVISNLSDPNSNLNVAFTDPNGTYKLIRLQQLDSADVTIMDGTTNLLQETNVCGNLNFVTQSNSTDLSILVTRTNYTNWAADVDLTSREIFNFLVNQALLESEVGNAATVENQETIIYLSRKLLQKNQSIQSKLQDESVPTLNINSVNQTTTNATFEKQEEIENLLLRLLGKTSTIKTMLEE